jgi:hypothetical protein
MFLVMARWDRHSDSLKKGQLTLSQGNMKEGDDVVDVDAVRTSVPQDRVTVILCNEELSLITQYI